MIRDKVGKSAMILYKMRLFHTLLERNICSVSGNHLGNTIQYRCMSSGSVRSLFNGYFLHQSLRHSYVSGLFGNINNIQTIRKQNFFNYAIIHNESSGLSSGLKPVSQEQKVKEENSEIEPMSVKDELLLTNNRTFDDSPPPSRSPAAYIPMKLFRRTFILTGVLFVLWLGAVAYFTFQEKDKAINLNGLPGPVIENVRKAVYWQYHDPDFEKAATGWVKVMDMVDNQYKLDQLDDKVSGLKIRMAEMFEFFERWASARKTYEKILPVFKSGLESDPRFSSSHPVERGELLLRTIRTSVRLGDICLERKDLNAARDAYTWAIEAILKEQKARGGSNDWIPQEEESNAFERLGQLYSTEENHALAIPLFLRALDVIGTKGPSCEAVILMNNVAAEMSMAAQGQIRVLEDAEKWAKKSLSICDNVSRWSTSEDCEFGKQAAIENIKRIKELKTKMNK